MVRHHRADYADLMAIPAARTVADHANRQTLFLHLALHTVVQRDRGPHGRAAGVVVLEEYSKTLTYQ